MEGSVLYLESLMFHQSLAQGQLRWEMGPRRIESWNCCWNLVGNDPDTRPGSLHHGDTNGNFYAFFGKTMPMISYDSDFNFQNWMRTSMDPWHLCVTSAKNDICTVRFVHGARIKTCSLLLNRDWTEINIPIHPQIFDARITVTSPLITLPSWPGQWCQSQHQRFAPWVIRWRSDSCYWLLMI